MTATPGPGPCLLPDFLPPTVLAEAREVFDRARFSEGAATATDAARAVKRNLQVDEGDLASLGRLQRLLLQAANASERLRSHARPLDLHSPRFARYEAGMGYGWHVDSPLMGHPPRRTDFAITIFLDGPDAYEGGELELRGPGGAAFRLPAGHAVVYPCDRVHRVAPIRAGVRRVMAAWIHSLVPDPGHRAVLAGLEDVHRRLDPATSEATDLQQQIAALTRRWARP